MLSWQIGPVKPSAKLTRFPLTHFRENYTFQTAVVTRGLLPVTQQAKSISFFAVPTRRSSEHARALEQTTAATSHSLLLTIGCTRRERSPVVTLTGRAIHGERDHVTNTGY